MHTKLWLAAIGALAVIACNPAAQARGFGGGIGAMGGLSGAGGGIGAMGGLSGAGGGIGAMGGLSGAGNGFGAGGAIGGMASAGGSFGPASLGRRVRASASGGGAATAAGHSPSAVAAAATAAQAAGRVGRRSSARAGSAFGSTIAATAPHDGVQVPPTAVDASTGSRVTAGTRPDAQPGTHGGAKPTHGRPAGTGRSGHHAPN